jgi:xanthine dehydrogenase molybdopterin-binding subunit B
VARIDAADKLCGRHRSPTQLSAAAARNVPGVVAVMLAADLPGTQHCGLLVADQPILCDEVVRRVRDPVALIVAETEAAARAGLPPSRWTWNRSRCSPTRPRRSLPKLHGFADAVILRLAQ